MGKKINQNLKRVGFNKKWINVWFTNDNKLRVRFIAEDNIIHKIIYDFFDLYSGVFEVNIIRNNMDSIEIDLWTSRYFVTVGENRENIRKLKIRLKKHLFNTKIIKIKVKNLYRSEKYYNFKTKTLEIIPAQTLSNRLAVSLIEAKPFRRVLRQGLYLAKKTKCLGCRITISGKLNGNRIARSESEQFGAMPLSSINKNIDYAKTLVKSKFGIMCVKIHLYNE